ncbi:hypothetical protein pb186bvf_005043 [Paramecium bursaria]
MIGIVPVIQRRVAAWGFWPQWTVKWIQSEKGPFTIFFYTPLIKWGISITNIGEMKRPVEQVNTLQQCVIALSGALFTRWCYVITPRVMMLVVCNFCMSLTGIYQLHRKYAEGQLFN